MEPSDYSDEQLIEMILRHQDRKTALHYIYATWRNGILEVLEAWGASNAQAKDAIHVALAKLEHTIRIHKHCGKTDLKSYLTRMAKKEFISEASDEQFIEMMLGRGKPREEVFRYIDKNWKESVKAVLLSKGGKHADIEDAVQESMIVFEKKVFDGSYKHEGKLKAYFIGICWGQYRAGQQRQDKVSLIANVMEFDRIENSNPGTLMLADERKEMVFKAVKMLNNKCQDVLRLFSQHFPYKEIAPKLDIDDELAVGRLVFNCKKKLIKLIDQNPFFNTFFNDKDE